jgi:acyl carrier protein
MTNLEKYDDTFTTSFSISQEALKGLVYQGAADWDSVGHMGLIAALEETFDIMMSTEDIVDFSSYEIGKTLLKKYDVAME